MYGPASGTFTPVADSMANLGAASPYIGSSGDTAPNLKNAAMKAVKQLMGSEQQPMGATIGGTAGTAGLLGSNGGYRSSSWLSEPGPAWGGGDTATASAPSNVKIIKKKEEEDDRQGYLKDWLSWVR